MSSLWINGLFIVLNSEASLRHRLDLLANGDAVSPPPREDLGPTSILQKVVFSRQGTLVAFRSATSRTFNGVTPPPPGANERNPILSAQK